MSEDDKTAPDAPPPRCSDYATCPGAHHEPARPSVSCRNPRLNIMAGGTYLHCPRCGGLWGWIDPKDRGPTQDGGRLPTLKDQVRQYRSADDVMATLGISGSQQVGAGDGGTVVPRYATVEQLDQLRHSLERQLNDIDARIDAGLFRRPDRRPDRRA